MKWALRMIMIAPKIVEGIMMIRTVVRMPHKAVEQGGQDRASGGPDEEHVDAAHRADHAAEAVRAPPR